MSDRDCDFAHSDVWVWLTAIGRLPGALPTEALRTTESSEKCSYS